MDARVSALALHHFFARGDREGIVLEARLQPRRDAVKVRDLSIARDTENQTRTPHHEHSVDGRSATAPIWEVAAEYWAE